MGPYLIIPRKYPDRYVISDIEHQGIDSGSFTYISEAYGSTSWIDHCVYTSQAHSSISAINVNYDTQSSDHFPRLELGLGLMFDSNNLLTLTIATKLTLTLPHRNPPN